MAGMKMREMLWSGSSGKWDNCKEIWPVCSWQKSREADSSIRLREICLCTVAAITQ